MGASVHEIMNDPAKMDALGRQAGVLKTPSGALPAVRDHQGRRVRLARLNIGGGNLDDRMQAASLDHRGTREPRRVEEALEFLQGALSSPALTSILRSENLSSRPSFAGEDAFEDDQSAGPAAGAAAGAQQRDGLFVLPVVKDELEYVGVATRRDLPKKFAGNDLASFGHARLAQDGGSGGYDVRLVEQESSTTVVCVQNGGEEGTIAAADVGNPLEPTEITVRGVVKGPERTLAHRFVEDAASAGFCVR